MVGMSVSVFENIPFNSIILLIHIKIYQKRNKMFLDKNERKNLRWDEWMRWERERKRRQ